MALRLFKFSMSSIAMLMGRDKRPVRMKVNPQANMPKTIVCQPHGTSHAGTALNSAGVKKFHLDNPRPALSSSTCGDCVVRRDRRFAADSVRVCFGCLAKHRHCLCGCVMEALHALTVVKQAPGRQCAGTPRSTVEQYGSAGSHFGHTPTLKFKLKIT